MADIKTEKKVIVVNDPQPSTINLNIGPGVVIQAMKNEGITHFAHLNPQEATQLGVTLIQLASQAAALAQHEAMRAQARAIVPPQGSPT